MQETDDVGLDLIAAWAAARSLSRGLPAPVRDGKAVRVDTGLPTEARRWIFAAATPTITALAATIAQPGILLKACAPLEALLALLPAGWRDHPQAYFMTLAGPMRDPGVALPAGYRLTIAGDGAIHAARIVAADGTLAARGRAARHGDLLVYDQIATDPGHRRRGLGSHIMHALATADGGGGRQALTATADGQALYTALGWRVASLYSTAEFGAEPWRD